MHWRGETVTYTWMLENGQQASTTADFQVHGPSGSTIPQAFVQTTGTASSVVAPLSDDASLRMANAPGMPAAGIWFNDIATLPDNLPGTGAGTHTGKFVWIQLLHTVTYDQISPRPGPSNVGEGFDGLYPYPSRGDNGMVTSDAPGRLALKHDMGEVGKKFDATMYTMWDPAIPAAGQASCVTAHSDTSTTPYTPIASTCSSIPVPLGSIRWEWAACAINSSTEDGSPSWALHCGQAKAFPPQADTFPAWTRCDASLYGGCQ